MKTGVHRRHDFLGAFWAVEGQPRMEKRPPDDARDARPAGADDARDARLPCVMLPLRPAEKSFRHLPCGAQVFCGHTLRYLLIVYYCITLPL